MATAELQLEEVQRLYDRGLYLQAYESAQQNGPLAAWSGPEARVLAARLVSNLGAGRLGSAWCWRAWREFPDHPLVQYYAVRTMLGRRGPWPVRKLMRQIGELRTDDVILRADWLAFQGVLAAMLRDFETADARLDAAEALAAENPWIHLERAEILMYEDRHEEALAAAQRALALRPWYRPGLQATAHLLQMLSRDEEALDLLRGAMERLEAGDLIYQLTGMLLERQRYAEARDLIERIPPLCPLMEKRYGEALAAQRSDAAYHCGDEAGAIEWARKAGKGFYEKLADRLAAAKPDDRRTVLEVPFVRQHHVTCAPATLTAIAKYWGRDVEHLDVAEKICYDGTPSQGERAWAVQAGFTAREFTVDLPTAAALIARGVPFTLTTVEPTSSHLQAVAGYDARRQTLLVRDSNYRSLGELTTDKGLEYYAPTGPRGMVLLPPEESHRIVDVALPDAELYDLLFEVLSGLDRFDRPTAAAAHERMRALAPFHRLTLIGRRGLAAYDNDGVAGRLACEQLVHQFPKSDVWLYAEWFYLRRLAPREERLAFLQKALDRHDSDVVFRLHLAEELIDDARTHAEAERVLRRYLRRRPMDARAYWLWAQVAWSSRRFEEAVQLYHAASCLEDKDEEHARAYFSAARRIKQTDAALEFLRNRFERFGKKSSYPGRTLFLALSTLDRMTEAFAVLEESIHLRPDDGRLLLFAADSEARAGRFERAADYLARCDGTTHPLERLRTAADVAWYRGDLSESLGYWKQLQEQDPQSVDAATSITRLTNELEGTESGLKQLRDLIERFPHNVALLQAAAEIFRDDDPTTAETLVRRMIEFNPVDPWARREMAITLAVQRRFAEALVEIEAAEPLEPTNPYVHSIRGRVLENLARLPEADAAYRRALELSVDNDAALDGLMRLQHDHAHRKEALDFIYDQLAQQTTYGDGLLAWGSYARNVFPPEQVLERLQAALDARPDLWHAWSAVVHQLFDMERYDEAQKLAEREVDRFSLVPGSYTDLAHILRFRGDDEGEIAALRRALEISPSWSVPLRRLVDAYERRGRYQEARAFVEQALRRNPTDFVLHGHLADLQWREGKRAEALATLERAVLLEPGYDWAWNRLRDCGSEQGEKSRAVDAARKLVERAPNHARSWIVLARTLEGPDALDERLASLDKALSLNPLATDPRVMRSRLLCEAERFDEAAATCTAAVFGASRPPALGVQEACVTAARGDRAAAIEQVRAVLRENPDHWNGWSQLAQWLEEDETRKADYLEAAERLADLAPTDAWSWRHTADARRLNDNLDGAKQAYERALAIDPTYEYCSNWLFDLAFDAGRTAEADQIMEAALTHAPGPYALARDVKRHAAARRRPQAVEALHRLLRAKADGDWPSRAAAEAFQNAGWREGLLAELREALGEERAEIVCERWVDVCTEAGLWEDCETQLHRKAKPEGLHAGMQHLLRAMASGGHVRKLRKFMERNRELLRSDTLSWGVAGYALSASAGCAQEAVEWMADWSTREGVESWMLINLANAFEILDRWREGRETRERGLALDLDRKIFEHRCYLALYELVDGNFVRARELVAGLDPAQMRADPAAACTTAQTALELLEPSVAAGLLGMNLISLYRERSKPHAATIAGDTVLKKLRQSVLVRILRERGHGLSAWFVRFFG